MLKQIFQISIVASSVLFLAACDIDDAFITDGTPVYTTQRVVNHQTTIVVRDKGRKHSQPSFGYQVPSHAPVGTGYQVPSRAPVATGYQVPSNAPVSTGYQVPSSDAPVSTGYQVGGDNAGSNVTGQYNG